MTGLFAMADDGPWSLGTLIGFPAALAFAFAFAVAAGFTFRWVRRNSHDYDAGAAKWVGAALAACAVGVLVGIASPIGMYPYVAEYHQFRAVSGTVADVDRRLISSGSDSMQDKFVVRFDGSDLQFGCDDTRCAQVNPGDELVLACKRAWQYTGTDGYDCRFTALEVAS